jgi:hypothetical protein
MEALSPQIAEARAKTILAYLKSVTQEGYDVTVMAKGASPENPNNAHLAFTLSASDIKSAPDNVKKTLPVPQEVQKMARHYESTIVLPTEGSIVLWYLKPVTGKHSHIVSYGRQLHAGGTEAEWLREKLEARKIN